MNEVRENMDVQQEKLEETRETHKAVSDKVEQSRKNMVNIKDKIMGSFSCKKYLYHNFDEKCMNLIYAKMPKC